MAFFPKHDKFSSDSEKSRTLTETEANEKKKRTCKRVTDHLLNLYVVTHPNIVYRYHRYLDGTLLNN